MKKSINILLVALLAAPFFIRCSDWTESEPLDYDPHRTDTPHGEAYYANLRDYKMRKKHSVAFGWFSDWTGTGTKMPSQLMGIPDSMDFVSMWGNWYGLSDEKKEDLRKVQQIKGTRVLMCFIVDNIGVQTTPKWVTTLQTVTDENGEPVLDENGNEVQKYIVNGKPYDKTYKALAAFWGWYEAIDEDDNKVKQYGPDGEFATAEERDAAMEAAIRKYANSFLDTIRVYGWDGFDLDLEPNYGHRGNLSNSAERLSILLDELSKELGPKSGTRKMLCVDGEPYLLKPEDGLLLDYFIIQAYEDTSYSDIDLRMERLFKAFNGHLTKDEVMAKTILTSNFESFGSSGGPGYRTRDGQRVNQLKGYAMYSYPGVSSKIGGIGAFRFVFDENYHYLRDAIATLNPIITK